MYAKLNCITLWINYSTAFVILTLDPPNNPKVSYCASYNNGQSVLQVFTHVSTANNFIMPLMLNNNKLLNSCYYGPLKLHNKLLKLKPEIELVNLTHAHCMYLCCSARG